ncbi:N-isopropylammelide isopropyl amidohydrolase [Peribacillus sp. Bi96]|uniref:amidohydrolase n=1 Tax=unclassified Peribacillus TaxID=2675266 RepID=UPI001DB8706C|nr:amidohydrolase [Peribacillus sp. Bi96]CAH0283580.1 N-isopropylammelide isopropyl amidohydrolase [Peribacillus sp. Bi96]
MNTIYWLKNARLECGYQKENERVTGTITGLFHLLIENGRITKIVKDGDPISTDVPWEDAKGLLVLPSFIEKHVHLDKTLMGDVWRACTPSSSVTERFENEKKVLPTIGSSTRKRAESLLEILLASGSTHVRTHVDIYPEVRLQNLEQVQQALAGYSNRLSSEIVAFAQHGLLRSDSTKLVREALRNGAGIVGAVDPATIDNDIEASLVQLMDLAVEANADVDLHLHDPGHLGTFTMKRLAALTKQAGWEGKVAVSHAFGIGDVSKEEAYELADILRDAGISIVTSVPINRQMPPVDLLHERGVEVSVGNDNIFDLWSPLGNGDILERAGRLAERFKWVDEVSLSQTLRHITGGKTPLDENGNQVWPKVGDAASLVLIDASCSAEAVARRSGRKAVIYKGNIVSGSLSKQKQSIDL